MNRRLDPRPQEAAPFARLRATARALGPSVRAWIVGGYVRDRLLGREPAQELDLVIGGTTGLKFARSLGADVHARGHGGPAAHLENGQALLDGWHADFVRLRRESYGPDSRVPQLDAGEATLQEDAARRDFTINALYLDLESGAVLDPCGSGFGDLASKRLRTPIDPLASLEQDPLRLFRGLRFAVQLEFALPPEWEALKHASGRSALEGAFEKKLSAARVREELLGRDMPSSKTGALTGPNAVGAWMLLGMFGVRERWLGVGRENAPARLRAFDGTRHEAPGLDALAARALLAVLGRDTDRALARLDVSRAIAERVFRAQELEARWSTPPSDRDLRAELYRDPTAVEDLRAVLRSGPELDAQFDARLDAARRAVEGGPPLGARDALALGWKEGPELGRAIARLRETWLDDPSLDADGARRLLVEWRSERK